MKDMMTVMKRKYKVLTIGVGKCKHRRKEDVESSNSDWSAGKLQLKWDTTETETGRISDRQ